MFKNKFFGIFGILLFGTFMLSACSTQDTTQTQERTATNEITAGTRVASQRNDGNYRAATVTNVLGGTYEILYDDGTKGTNTKDKLIVLSETNKPNVGDKVMAVWSSNGRFYNGTIIEVKAGSAVVKRDDGSSPTEVVFGKITKQVISSNTYTPQTTEAFNFAPAEKSNLVAGTKVASKRNDGNYRAATVTNVLGETYEILYDDGTKGTNTNDKLVILSETKPNVGDKVIAVWSSNGRFYDGVITEVKAGSAIVQREDGSSPTEVIFGKILIKK